MNYFTVKKKINGGNLESPIGLTLMFWESGKKPKYLTPPLTQKAWSKKIEVENWTYNLLAESQVR